MKKLTKTLLVLTVIGFATGLIFVSGLINVGDAVALYVTLPTGAICFGLFLISRMLEKEVALYDADLKAAFRNPQVRKPCCEGVAHEHDKALASAH